LAGFFDTLVSIETAISDITAHVVEMRTDPGHFIDMRFKRRVSALKDNVSATALEVVDGAKMVCDLQGYVNNTPYSLGRHLRDIHSARLVIGSDRILARTEQMMLAGRSTAGTGV